MSDLSGNRWVKEFTIFLRNLIKNKNEIPYDNVIYECMKEKGVKGITTEKYLAIMELAGIITITTKSIDNKAILVIHYKGD